MASGDIDMLIKQLQKMSSDWQKTVNEVGQKAAIVATSQAVTDMIKEFRPKFDKVVDSFYAAYSPEYYRRRKSMYNILKISSEQNGLEMNVTFDWDDGDMTYRDGSTGLMELTFGLGYHGGAIPPLSDDMISVEAPRYRNPVFVWSQWSRAAIRSESPYKKYIDWLTEFWTGPTFQNLFAKYCADEFEKGLRNAIF